MRRRVNLDMYYSNREQNQLCTCVCQHSYVNQACRSNMWQHLSCATPTSADIVKATCHIWLSILHNVMAVFSEWKNKVPTFFLLSSSSCLYFETCLLFFSIHSSSLNFSTMCNISKHPSQFDAHKLNNIWFGRLWWGDDVYKKWGRQRLSSYFFIMEDLGFLLEEL